MFQLNPSCFNTMSVKIYTKTVTYLALAQSLIAFNIVSAKYSLQYISTNDYLTMRYLFAFIISLIGYLCAPKHPKKQNVSYSILFLQAVTGGLLFNIPMTKGLSIIDASVAGIITSLLPIFTILLSCVFFQTKLTRTNILAIGFSFLGLLLISLSQWHESQNQHPISGDLWVLLAIVPEAIYYILSQRFPAPISIFLNGTIIFGVNALLFIVLFLLNPHPMPSIPQPVIFLISIQGFALSLYYVFWLKGCRHAHTTLVSISAAFMPIMTIVLAFLFLHEQINNIQIVGIFIIIMTIIMQKEKIRS